MDRNTIEIPEKLENSQELETEVPQDMERTVKKRRNRRKKKYFLRFLVVLAVIGCVVFCMSLDVFNIKTIKVEGNKYVKTSQVLKETEIKKGDNIFATNKRQIKKRMEVNPFYTSIDINKNLPGEIVITVTERTPLAVLPYGDKFVLLDGEGIVLGLSKTNPKLTEISGITIKNMEKGEVLEAKEKDVFQKSLDVLNLATKTDLFYKKIKLDGSTLRCNIYDNLAVKGEYDEVMANMKNGNLENIVYDLYKKKIKRGTVKIEGDKYCSFTPIFE